MRIFQTSPKRSRARAANAAALIFTLFQKSLTTDEVVEEAAREDEGAPDFGRIRCPACRWRPNASSRWACGDCGHPEHFYGGCGAVWNTFDTRGRCPGCGHLWRWTRCLSCRAWSPHEDWYEKEGGDGE
jgi:hypothetical protein